MEAFYLIYVLFFMFNNRKSYSIYTKDVLKVKNMNRNRGRNQLL